MPSPYQFLPHFHVLGPSPADGEPATMAGVTTPSANPLTKGKRALCTTSDANSGGDPDELAKYPDRLVRKQPFVFNIRDCAHLCERMGDKCTHFSLNLGPGWNRKSGRDCAHLCERMGDKCTHFSLNLGPGWNRKSGRDGPGWNRKSGRDGPGWNRKSGRMSLF